MEIQSREGMTVASYKKSEEAKKKILKAASRIFLEKGYHAATVRNICEEAGVSVTRISYHFESKAKLAETICEIFLHNFYDRTKELIGSTIRFSWVTELIQLQFIVSLFLPGEDQPYQAFYHDVFEDGIWAQAFQSYSREIFRAARDSGYRKLREITDRSLALRSGIFAAALPAMASVAETETTESGKLFDLTQAQQREELEDAYCRLFMQMFGLPESFQDGNLASARAYSRILHVEMNDLTDVVIKLGPLEEIPEGLRVAPPKDPEVLKEFC